MLTEKSRPRDSKAEQQRVIREHPSLGKNKQANKESATEDHRLVQASYRLQQSLQVTTRALQITAGPQSVDELFVSLYRLDRGSAEAVQSPRQASGHE